MKGPITAIFSALAEAGWIAYSPTSWYDPEGNEWKATGAANTRQIEEAVRADLTKLDWEAAATGRLGQGLAEGAWLHVLHKVTRTLSPSAKHMAEQIAVGGLWLRQRLFEARKTETGLCRHCGQAEETEQHIFWECTELDNNQSKEGMLPTL